MLAIENFGYLWERKYIDRKRGGTLWGAGQNGKIDFSKQIAIYVLYDRDRVPVYIGQTGRGEQRLLSRLRSHSRNHLWNRWEYFSWFGLLRVSGGDFLKETTGKPFGGFDEALDEIEAILIQVMEPRLNKQGPRWKSTEEYFQYVDDELREISIEDVFHQQNEIKERLDLVEAILKKNG